MIVTPQEELLDALAMAPKRTFRNTGPILQRWRHSTVAPGHYLR